MLEVTKLEDKAIEFPYSHEGEEIRIRWQFAERIGLYVLRAFLLKPEEAEAANEAWINGREGPFYRVTEFKELVQELKRLVTTSPSMSLMDRPGGIVIYTMMQRRDHLGGRNQVKRGALTAAESEEHERGKLTTLRASEAN